MATQLDSKLKKKTIKTMKGKNAFRKELETMLSPDECEKIWRDAHKRLYRMYDEHRDLPKGVATHTDGFIFPAAAIYLAMKKTAPDLAYDVMKKVMAEKSTKTGRTMAKWCRIPGFSRFFLGTWDGVSHKMFGETAGFKNVFYPKEKGCFRMDITQCPYNIYLTEQGCPELNILFCENDVHAYGNLPGLKFSRTKTIGAGDDLCDFKLELMQGRKA
ncbi:MAG: L-2-amino-thiazoline-4-carboxylic acid hydrolase [Lachnospiraceae bacterium]|nr:L-2-amino-thiazoline-4-carboxylic acid hydrolase [Lachnospiraceae bacterium]